MERELETQNLEKSLSLEKLDLLEPSLSEVNVDGLLQPVRWWLPGLLQFLSSATISSILRFNIVFWHDLGFKGTELAMLSVSCLIGSFLGSVFWGVLTDWIGGVKQVLLVSHLFSMLSASCCLLPCVRSSLTSLMPTSVAVSFFLAGDMGVIDSLCLSVSENSGSYGSMRALNCCGCGIICAVLGAAIPVFGINTVFYTFLALQVPFLVLLLVFIPNIQVNKADSALSLHAVLTCLRSYDSIVFFANLFLYGLVFSLIEVFGAVYYMDVLHCTSATVGVAILFMCLAEVVVFHFIDDLMKRWQVSWKGVINLCQIMLAVRCVGYALIPPSMSWLALCNEWLHGINFAAMWFVTVQRADELAPEGARATMQSLASSTYFCLSFGLGGLLWGKLIQEPPYGIGWPDSLAASGAVALLWGFVFRQLAAVRLSEPWRLWSIS